jgi:hypothetical protein
MKAGIGVRDLEWKEEDDERAAHRRDSDTVTL